MIQICIVDDDASMRKSLTNLLKSAGFRPAAFASGEDFLASSLVGQAACVLLDVCMPGLSGLQVQQALTARGATIGVICMSAHDDGRAINLAMAAGAGCFLRKPFSEQLLMQSIRAVLKR